MPILRRRFEPPTKSGRLVRQVPQARRAKTEREPYFLARHSVEKSPLRWAFSLSMKWSPPSVESASRCARLFVKVRCPTVTPQTGRIYGSKLVPATNVARACNGRGPYTDNRCAPGVVADATVPALSALQSDCHHVAQGRRTIPQNFFDAIEAQPGCLTDGFQGCADSPSLSTRQRKAWPRWLSAFFTSAGSSAALQPFSGTKKRGS